MLRAAPAIAAAIATMPEPDPKSTIVLPLISSGLSNKYRASTCPLAQQNAQ